MPERKGPVGRFGCAPVGRITTTAERERSREGGERRGGPGGVMEMDDPFVRDYEASELKIAAEFLTNWLPFLTRDLCDGCAASMRDRIRSLDPEGAVEPSVDEGGDADPGEALPSSPGSVDNGDAGETGDPGARSPRIRMSWADMAQEDELEMEAEEAKGQALADAEKGGKEVQMVEKTKGGPVAVEKKTELSREQREYIRFMNVGRMKDFICLERVKGKIVNVLDGLELHTGVFSAAEQKRIVDFVYELQDKGRRGELGERTYSEPEKWMRGKGRVTIQFGCCYNYAMDRDGNPAGILRNVAADPIPQLFKVIVKRLIRWHVLHPSHTPDSCIVNIYEAGDCIPPHIDSHDFVRPFCTISFLSECDIVFGFNLKIAGPAEFIGSTAIPLPVGSVLVLNGNGADVAKHCVPGVAQKRISITFRKMDAAKRPFAFQPEPDLQGIQPLVYDTYASHNKVSPRSAGPSAESRGPESQHTHSARHSEPRSRKALPRDVVVGRGRRKPSRVVVDGRSVLDGGKAEEPAGPSSQASSPVSDLPGILPLPKGAAELMRRPSSHPVRTPGRTVSVEQKRIVIRSYVEDGEQEPPSSSVSSEPPGNHLRFHGTRSIDRRRWRGGMGADGAD